MKDLYTFDYTAEMALETYSSVRSAYSALFDELKVPYLVADADSGAMGGNLSHEYHFISPKGEDNVCACDTCAYVANEELAEKKPKHIDFNSTVSTSTAPPVAYLWIGIGLDRSTLVRVFYPATPGASQEEDLPNLHAVKAVFPALDTSISGEAALRAWGSRNTKSRDEPSSQVLQIIDQAFSTHSMTSTGSFNPPREANPLVSPEPSPISPTTLALQAVLSTAQTSTLTTHPTTGALLDLTRIRTGDACPRCATGALHVHRAIEVGHTFHLGTRYSVPLAACVPHPAHAATAKVPLQMGCHGIGVSRLIGALAAALADAKGLNWPRAVAPFEVVVIPGKDAEGEAVEVYDRLGGGGVDVVLDDRERSLAWKMKDADLIGYPVVVVLGKAWKRERLCEVQCRRLGVRRDVGIEELEGLVRKELLERL